MTDLPTGTVTFLFTDIEGSTRRWQEDPSMSDALARHDEVLRSAIENGGGHVVKHTGDGVLAVFARASSALGAAVEAQRRLCDSRWSGQPLRVRMGLHTGEATERDGDYFGPTVNAASRILDSAHGGQVIVSEVTRAMVEDALPGGVELRDLGEHRLKDLEGRRRLSQLCAPGLEEEFSPPRTLEATPNNLPVQPTSFIGREEELTQVGKLLEENRLLTLTGVGGSGKTRLALKAAAHASDTFPDGVFFIELASLTDPEAVGHTVAGVLGISESDREESKIRSITERLAEHLGDRKLLLVLDNCEHVLGAAGRLADHLLRSCPKTSILATSREGLGIAGETLWQVPSLGLPESEEAGEVASDAERLFAERARAVAPSFTVTPATRPAVVQICLRLDGIPLAIELAASRVRVLGVEQLANRLDDRFRILSGGSRTALPRQQTLEATIDWSYKLLDDAERRLFARLSVFAGGFTLEAAAAVCGGEGVDEVDILDLLSSLVDKSLIEPQEGPTGLERYRLLETVRQFARSKLDESGEADEIRRHHRDHFAAFATEAEGRFWPSTPHFWSDETREWIPRVEIERDNLQAALDWALEHDADEKAGGLAAIVGVYWGSRGHDARSISLIRTAVDLANEGMDVERRAMRLSWLHELLTRNGDEEGAMQLAEEAYGLLEDAEPSAAKVRVLMRYAYGFLMGIRTDPELAIPPAREALATSQGLGDPVTEMAARTQLGFSLIFTAAIEEGLQNYRSVVDIARRLNDPKSLIGAYLGLHKALFYARHEHELQDLTQEIWSYANSQDEVVWGAWTSLFESSLQGGDWAGAAEALDRWSRSHLEGMWKDYRNTCRGMLAWVRGRLDSAAEAAVELHGTGAAPRVLHDAYPLLADIACDQGRIEDVRTVAQEYLDLEVHPSEEAMKAAVLRPLVHAEVDGALASPGAERREEHVRRARAAIATLRSLLDRYPPRRTSPQFEFPATHSLLAEAELTRVTGPDPRLWRRALEGAWMAHTRAYCRFRLAEALLATGERDEATTELRAAHQKASELGAGRIQRELEALADREAVSVT